MLMIAVVLNVAVALGLAALGAKYAFGPAPADYHGAILEKAGANVAEAHKQVIGALNAVLGATLFAIALVVALVALFGVGADVFWAKATLLGVVLVAGGPSIVVARGLEQATAVRTPWRPAAAMVGLGVLAFVAAVV